MQFTGLHNKHHVEGSLLGDSQLLWQQPGPAQPVQLVGMLCLASRAVLAFLTAASKNVSKAVGGPLRQHIESIEHL